MEKKPYYLDCYKKTRGWYWRIICRQNGKTVATGGEPFSTKQSAHTSFQIDENKWTNMDNIDLEK